MPFYLTGQEFEIRFVGYDVEENQILPTIELNFNRISTRRDQNPDTNIVVNLSLQISVKKNEYSHMVVGYARSEVLQQTWKTDLPDNRSSLRFFLTIDNYTLSQIEKIRHGGNLRLKPCLHFQSITAGLENIQENNVPLDDIVIAKSDWVELLSRLNYKNVALVEIPRLEYKRLDKAINLLNDAWKGYSMGDIDQVLVNCRKTLEAIKKQVKEAGFVKEEEATDKKGNKYMAKYPDWKKFFDSDSKDKTVEIITRKVLDFVAPGAHDSNSILDVNHAYFAILQAFSLTHLVISRFKMLEAKD